MDSDFAGGGAVRVGDSTSTCDGTTEGAIRFDADGANTLDYCDGLGWLTLLTSSVGNGIVNNGNSFAAPMIIGTNDAQELRLETNSTTRLTIDTSGNVGIGSVTPSEKLDIVGNMAISGTILLNNSQRLRWGASYIDGHGGDNNITFHTNGTERMRLFNDSLGIGTTMPAVELDVHTGSINAASICDEDNANCKDISTGWGGGSGDFMADGSVAMTDQLFATTGTSAAPGVSFDGDPNTGMYRNGGSDQIGFATNGTARMIIDNQGFRGFANDSPKLLDDAGAEATPSYTFVSETNTGFYLAADDNIGIVTGGTERLRIDENGFFGIGTNNPDSILHVEPTAAATSTAGANVKIYAQDSTGPASSAGGDIYLEVGNGAGGWGSGYIVADVHDTFMAVSKGANTTYTAGSEPNAHLILDNGWFVDGNSSFINYEVASGSNFQQFYTGAFSNSGGGVYSPSYAWVQQTGASSFAERMRINPVGYLGIGTTTPVRLLHVYDDAAGFVSRFENINTASTADGIIIQIGPTSNPGAGNHFINFEDGDGTVVGKVQGDGSGGVTYNTTSDRRIKRNIVDTHYGIEDVLNIQVRDYNPLNSEKDVTGFIAQELFEVYPLAVSPGETEDEIWTVDYSRVTPLLTKGLQDIYGMCKATDADLLKISKLSQQNKRDIASLKKKLEEKDKAINELKSELRTIKAILQRME